MTNSVYGYWYLGSGDYTIEPYFSEEAKEMRYSIVNQFANCWHKLDGSEKITLWPSRDKLVQWLNNRHLYITDMGLIRNPITATIDSLLTIIHETKTSYDERLAIGIFADSVKNYYENPSKKGRLTSNFK